MEMDTMKNNNIIEIVFCLRANISTGRGTENYVLNLVKYKPEDINVLILDTDFTPVQRLSNVYVQNTISPIKRITIHRTNFANIDNIFLRMYRLIISNPIRKDIKRLKKTEYDTYNRIRRADVAYLFANEYSILFRGRNIPVIGSNHSDELTMFHPKSFASKLYSRFYIYLNFRYINGMHIFPKQKWLLPVFEKKYGMKNNFILPIGVDTNLFYPNYTIHNIKLKFLFVAALNYSKGLDIILPLIERFDNENIEFHVAGGGPLQDMVNSNKKIIYHGVLSNNDLAILYRQCDVLIYPSHNDNYPAVVLEALSSGLYVLIGDYLKGNFDDFANKYLEYLPMTVDAFYNKINEIIKNRTIIEHDKKEEYDFVKDNYDWAVIAPEFYREIRNIVDET